jgi:hypothetical protein
VKGRVDDGVSEKETVGELGEIGIIVEGRERKNF